MSTLLLVSALSVTNKNMAPRPSQLSWLAYLVMGLVGAGLTYGSHGALMSPPARVSWAPAAVELASGAALALVVAFTTTWASRMLVDRTRWGQILCAEHRARLLGASAGRLAMVAVFGALFEELLFRAGLMPLLGILGSSVLFALLHFRPGPLAWSRVGWAFGMGVVFAALYDLSGHLLVPVLAHALINYENMQLACYYEPGR